MEVQLFDLTRQYENIREEVLSAIDGVIRSGRVILAENVEHLENEVAKYIGVKHAIGLANGSDALVIALRSIGISEGDYVITTPFTFFATVSCITRNGATPIFVDINYEDFNINLDEVEEYLSGNREIDPAKIKAIVPVHLFGKTVNLQRLQELKTKYGVAILEDAAQSIGSLWVCGNGTKKYSGSVGDAGIFSFFPTKNLGCYGDGGMIVTNDDEIFNNSRILRKHGAEKKYYHKTIGFNSRLDEIQAAILRIKLKRLEEYTNNRIRIARKYKEFFEKYGLSNVELPEVFGDHRHVYHQYVVRIKKGDRNSLKSFLSDKGIRTSIYYPLPLHKQECFADFSQNYTLPIAEEASREVLALPIFPELKDDEVEYVVKTIKEWENDL